MNLREFFGKQTYIWGMGVEGHAAMDFLAKKLPELKIGIIENDIVPADAEVVIKSPGVSVYKDEYIQASARGVKFTSLLNIFFAELNAQEKRPIVIAVTGTKGKTTTASMLAFMLNKLGKKTGLGGNIGTPPLDFLGKNLDYIVLELSSFQNTSLEYFPDYCIVVSISPAHLDWHLDYENYKRDKLRILQPSVKKYLCGYDEYLKTLTMPNAKFYYKTKLPLPALKVFGEHNVINLSGALEIVKDLGLDEKAALSAMTDFEPIEHRLQKVYEHNGIMFIDDSIATVAE
jgi:UDP-N-acetylmuramoylalanine--D-glutamate ligase